MARGNLQQGKSWDTDWIVLRCKLLHLACAAEKKYPSLLNSEPPKVQDVLSHIQSLVPSLLLSPRHSLEKRDFGRLGDVLLCSKYSNG